MTRFVLIIIFILALYSGYSQKSFNNINCKIISIDTSSILPNYLIIKAQTVKGKIMILSSKNNPKCDTVFRIIKLDESYNMNLIELDSVLVIEPDHSYYFKFSNIRGGNDRYTIYVTDQDKEVGRLEFEDFNFKPFNALNLKGLYYTELE
jgi:hypothetical protein